MYYALYCLDPAEGSLAGMEYDESLDEDFLRSWISGEAFEIQPPVPVVLECRSQGVMPELLQVPVPIMTERLFQVLLQAGVTNLETFPAEIHSGDDLALDYKAFNVVGTIRTEDLTASSGPKLVRLEESVNVLLVDESVKDAILSSGISTLTFIENSDIALV